MTGFVGIIAFLTVLGLSLVITRIATTALTLTGMSREAARFQARSAFTGTGFTTHEAEQVVGHPVRRRIIMLLMILRSAGLVSILISIIL
ncbi:MAG: potassium transporter TrkA, partial [Candidatus Eisenbacteria bacterium]|nr:potassium transporter TrkA [Candidatus Eisenbacteria bacterium]